MVTNKKILFAILAARKKIKVSNVWLDDAHTECTCFGDLCECKKMPISDKVVLETKRAEYKTNSNPFLEPQKPTDNKLPKKKKKKNVK